MLTLVARLAALTVLVGVGVPHSGWAQTQNLSALNQKVVRLRQVMPAQRHLEQELDTGHDPVAIADARPALDQVQLERLDFVGSCGLRRSPKKGGEPLAAVDPARTLASEDDINLQSFTNSFS